MRGRLPSVVTLVLIAWASVAAAQSRSMKVVSDPPGATIVLNGRTVGVAPAGIALPDGIGTALLTLRKSGYGDRTLRLDLAAPPPSTVVRLALRRGRIPVTASDDRRPAPDGAITLREAIGYASGALRPVGTDRALIDGPVGAGRPDDILIETAGQGASPVLTVRSPLPALEDPGDRLLGPPARATIAPAPGSVVRGAGLMLGPGASAASLVLDGFDTGFAVRGVGPAAFLRDVTALGAWIGFEAVDGGELTLSGAVAAGEFAGAVAHGGGVVDGIVEPASEAEAGIAVLLSGPPGAAGHTVVEGRLPSYAGANFLYVRQETAVPLRDVPDLDATTTSYNLYHIFGAGQSDQRWPRHVYDGRGGDFFQWAFRGEPKAEHMTVMSRRPMRTDRFELHHLAGDSRLVRYRFSLRSRNGLALWSTDVTASGAVDTVAVDPGIDFFGFRIDVLEAIGTTPGFTEIEAMVFDTIAYPPRSVSRRRAVFPRPEAGKRGLIELAGALYPVEDAVFAERAEFEISRVMGSVWPAEMVEAVLPAEAGNDDLVKALAAVADAPAATIRIPGRLRIDAATPAIGRRFLRLTGGGEIRSLDGAPLRVESAGHIVVSDLRFAETGVALKNASAVVIHDVAFVGFKTAIDHRYSDLAVSRSRFSRGDAAIRGIGGALTMTDSNLEDVGVGVDVGAGDPLILIGNTIHARAQPLNLRPERHFAGVAHLIGNVATVASADLQKAHAAYHSRQSIVAQNDPPLLGLDPTHLETSSRPRWTGTGLKDVRQGAGQSYLRLLDLSGMDGRCLLRAEPGEPPLAPPVPLLPGVSAVLHDRNAEVVCVSAEGGASLSLPVGAETAPGALPATARLLLKAAEGFVVTEADAFASTEIAAHVSAIGDGRALPGLQASRARNGLRRLVDGLAKTGNHALALEQAFEALRQSPQDRGLVRLVAFTANDWADAMIDAGRADAARDLLLDVVANDPSGSDIGRRFVGVFLKAANGALKTGAWQDARAFYRDVLDIAPENDIAANNIGYAYGKEAAQVMAEGGAAALIAWVEAEAAAWPASADDVARSGAIVIGNAAVDAINAGRFVEGLAFATAHYRWTPDEQTRNRLKTGFLLFAQDSLARGDTEPVAATLANLTETFGSDLGLRDGLPGVFGVAVQKALKSDDAASGLAMAEFLHRLAPSPDADNLLAYAYGTRADALLGGGNGAAALDLVADALARHPDIAGLVDTARVIGNNAALTANAAGDLAGAVALFERTVALIGPHPNLMRNLRVIYANWAIGAANGGRWDEADRAARAGLVHFPDDKTLRKVVDHVKRKRRR